MNKQYALFIDIDGTLYDHKISKIPSSAIDAIFKAKENGHKLFICSGRPYTALSEELLNLPFDGYVVSCGANICINGENIFVNKFNQDDLLYLINSFKENDIGFLLELIDKSFLHSYALESYRTYIKKDIPSLKTMEEVDAHLESRKLYKYERISDEDYQRIVKITSYPKNKDKVLEIFSKLSNEYTIHFDNVNGNLYGEILPKSVSKATGIDEVIKYFNIPLSNTIAIGDSINDLEMIKHAGIGIAMGNARDTLKEHADFVSKPIGEDGFAYALKHFNIIE